VSDPFVPEADSLDQRREVTPSPVRDEAREPALDYPDRLPVEADAADVLEQDQSVYSDEDLER
jgi:hypothetical protein